MFDEDWSDYDEDVPSGTGFCHSHNDFCDGHYSEKGTGKEGLMKKIKVIEIVFLAVSALVTSALYAIKFIKQVDKLQAA